MKKSVTGGRGGEDAVPSEDRRKIIVIMLDDMVSSGRQGQSEPETSRQSRAHDQS